MDSPRNIYSFNCELRIIRAKNIEFVHVGNLFVRCYLITGDSRRIHIASQEITSTCEPCWNEPINLECAGGEDAMENLKRESVVFELRWGKMSPVLIKLGGSKLLLRAEIGWKDVLESTELSLQKWVTSPDMSNFVSKGVKPPALEIGMKVQYPEMSKMVKKNRRRSKEGKECGCGHGGCNDRNDDDIFALAAGLDAF